MRVIIDTNIVLDVLLHRTEFFDASYKVMRLSTLGKAETFVTASAITDIYYFLHRANKDAGKSKESILRLLNLVTIADTIGSDIMNALSGKIMDFEDAVVGAIAKRIKAEYIVTRNAKDFSNSPIPAIDPKNFLAQISDRT